MNLSGFTEEFTNWRQTLPVTYDHLRVSNGSRPIGFRFSKFIINIEASLSGTSIVACGEANTQEQVVTKALAELIERSAMMQFYAGGPEANGQTSNGWAAHTRFDRAKQNAIFELVERDGVLSQWYCREPFFQLQTVNLPKQLQQWAETELSQSELPILKILLSTKGIGPSATCLLLNKNGFGVSGHSSKPNLVAAIESALAEACRAAHLTIRRSFWNDSLLLKKIEGPAKRISPGAHAVFYAYHRPFPQWMFGRDLTWNDAVTQWESQIDQFYSNEYPGFSFQMTLDEPLVVGVARNSRSFEPAWGATDENHVFQIAQKRSGLALTYENINCEPHIVA